MIKFDKKDIPVLDFIIEKSIVKYPEPVFLTDLINNEYSDIEINEFERLMFIILKYDCADCRFIPPHINDQSSSVTKNIRTSQFKFNGGFKKAFKDLNKPLDWYKITPIFLALIFGCSTIYYSRLDFLSKENQSVLSKSLDSLKVENSYLTEKNNRLLKVVDSLKTHYSFLSNKSYNKK
jgi:hypothetical protein